MLNNFEHIVPGVIFNAVEQFGGICTGRFLPLNAMENRVYDVELESGEHRIIKFYRPGRWDRSTILSEHAFLLELEKNEVPVVCPLQKDGETLLNIERVFFAVFPKKRGRLEPELNKEQLQRLGRFLARIHNVGAHFPKTPRLELNVENFAYKAFQALKNTGLLPINVEPKIEHLVHQIGTRISPLFSGVEMILLHGDCHAGNILWLINEPFFIDFDDMLYAPPVQDIWMLTGAEDEDGRQRKEILLEAYEQIRTFDSATLKLIEPLRTLRMIYFNSWIATRWQDGAFKMAFPYFGTERYWQEQIESLSFQLERLG